MDFSSYKAVDSSNTRKVRANFIKGQEFDDLRYKKVEKKTEAGVSLGLEGKFFVSNARMNSLNLATNGLRLFTVEGQPPLLGVVGNNDARMLKSTNKSKKGNKTKNFKSDKLEASLAGAGVIDPNNVGHSQFISLVSVGTNVEINGIKVSEVFTLAKGEKRTKVKTTPSMPSQGEGVDGTPTPKAQTAKADW